MDLPDISFVFRLIEFLFREAGPVWAAWLFVGWLALMLVAGFVGTLSRRERE